MTHVLPHQDRGRERNSSLLRGISVAPHPGNWCSASRLDIYKINERSHLCEARTTILKSLMTPSSGFYGPLTSLCQLQLIMTTTAILVFNPVAP